MPVEILSVFEPMPPQRAFMLSDAKIRGYGGAMGGGKSRTGCEAIFDACLDHPGLTAVVARQAHTSIVETTKKTMLNQVIDPRLITKRKASGGEDYVQLFNGSTIHFVGLDDPYRWYSSEIGYAFFDECQEIDEDTVLRIITRLRQRCSDCERNSVADCNHMPNRAILTFNPSNPGHWLQQWFMLQRANEPPAVATVYPDGKPLGYRKEALWMEGASSSIGSAEFFFALATDNIHLPPGYVEQTLGGMKEWMRRRYLEGLWEFISGEAYFNPDTLREYEQIARETPILIQGQLVGDVLADVAYRTGKSGKPKDRIKIVQGDGPLCIWKKPVRQWEDENGKVHPAHRYVIAVDASSGRGSDYSALEVIDVETFEQVAEMQVKSETGIVAEEAYRLGRIYNDAMIVCELTGGWGLAVEQVLKRFRYPKPYTRRVMDRLSQKYTDRTGWDTTPRLRAVVLENLDYVLRDHSLKLYSLKAVGEMGTFVYSDKEKPEAQPGCNDDIVMALAIGVTVVLSMPRELKRVKEKPHEPQFAVTGY